MGFIISSIICGVIAGYAARALVPGDDSMSVVKTIGLGILGSLLAGAFGYFVFNRDTDEGFFQMASIFTSIIGAVVALLAINFYNSRKS